MSIQLIKQNIQNRACKFTPFKSSSSSGVKKISWNAVKSLKTIPSSIVGTGYRMRHCAIAHRYHRLIDHNAVAESSFSTFRFKKTRDNATGSAIKKPKAVKQRVKISVQYDGNDHEYQSNRTDYLNKK